MILFFLLLLKLTLSSRAGLLVSDTLKVLDQIVQVLRLLGEVDRNFDLGGQQELLQSLDRLPRLLRQVLGDEEEDSAGTGSQDVVQLRDAHIWKNRFLSLRSFNIIQF